MARVSTSVRDAAPVAGARTEGDIRAEEGSVEWDRIAALDEFKALVAARTGFILPATIFFIAYYFALPILVGYFPSFMDTPILGPVNIAYLFALSQFFMAWILAYLYLRKAAHFDELEQIIIAKVRSWRGGK